MEKTTSQHVKFGIFISTSILLFILALYFIGKRQQLFSNTFHISTIFTDINGLQIGNNVRFSGINVGVVDDIQQISDSTVRVDLIIDDNSRKFIKKNATATVGSDGLMGNKLIIIIPGESGQSELANNDIITSAQSITMDQILLQIKVTTDNAAIITDDLAVIINNIREGKGTIGKLLVDSVFAQTLDDALVNIKHGAGGFKQNMKAASNNILLRGFSKKKKSE
ncbi:MAG: MlaD family protein [Bacteroidota bacterium]